MQKWFACLFGSTCCYWINLKENIGSTNNKASYGDYEYQAIPEDFYITGTKSFKVLSVEVFQLNTIP